MPSDVASAAGRSSIADRAPHRRIQGSEGQKVIMRKYARRIDQALRPFLNGLDVPLILAASEPMDSIFRSVNTYPQLAPSTIAGNPEGTPDAQLAERARAVLDDLYADELRQVHERGDPALRARPQLKRETALCRSRPGRRGSRAGMQVTRARSVAARAQASTTRSRACWPPR